MIRICPAQVRHAERAHRQRHAPQHLKHRAHIVGVVVVCALAQRQR
jgi:hypothetical protein